MQDSASIARTWRLEQRRAIFACVVATHGLGPRNDNEITLIDSNGDIAGSVLGGALDQSLGLIARDALANDDTSTRVVGLEITMNDAEAAGLTCGGQVDVLVQRLDTIPIELWDALAEGRPVALAVNTGARPARTAVFFPNRATIATLGESALDTLSEAEAEGLLALPGNNGTEVHLGTHHIIIQSWNPVPQVVVLGENKLSRALTKQFDLFGWSTNVIDNAEAAVAAVGNLTRGDIVLVLDHHPQTATPVLFAALRAGLGYVGALGSRRTQTTRRTHLERAGLTAVELGRLHGPAGLDLGGRTPAETAVSIAAEILSFRSGRKAQPLQATTGRISP